MDNSKITVLDIPKLRPYNNFETVVGLIDNGFFNKVGSFDLYILLENLYTKSAQSPWVVKIKISEDLLLLYRLYFTMSVLNNDINKLFTF